MVEHLGSLSLVKSEVEGQGGHKSGDAEIKLHEWPVTMSMSIKGIISQFISVWLIVSVWLVNDQIGMGIWRENVLVTIEIRTSKYNTY